MGENNRGQNGASNEININNGVSSIEELSGGRSAMGNGNMAASIKSSGEINEKYERK